MNQKYMIYMYLLKARTFIALLLVIAFFSVMVPNFLTASNLLIMTQHVAITGLLAIGMTLVILTGGIDLSVGAVAGICGMVAGALLTNGLPLWNGDILFFNVPEVILCVAIFGVLVGLVNGAVITRFGVAPFICTLGMMYVARGSALLFNDGSTYPNLNGMEALGNTGFATLGSGTLLGVYLPIWLMIGFLVLGYWLTTKTPLGRYIYAIGGNESAARLAGVPIVKAKIFVYAFSGLCAAFVGLIVASQLQTAHPMTGNMFEMDAIGATVLGGTALAGGRGRVTGSIIGAFVIVFLADGMVMMGVSDFWQMVIKGVVIVTAVVVDQFQQKLQSKVILMRRHEENWPPSPPTAPPPANRQRFTSSAGPGARLSEREKYATRFPEQNGGDHRRLPRHRRRHCRALCPRRRESGDGLQRRARSRDRRNPASALSGGYFIAAGRCHR